MGFFGRTTRHGQTWRDELGEEEFALRLIESNRKNPRWPTITDEEIDALKARIAYLRPLAKQEADAGTAVAMRDIEIPLFLRRQAN